jgi:hypothetical protein
VIDDHYLLGAEQPGREDKRLSASSMMLMTVSPYPWVHWLSGITVTVVAIDLAGGPERRYLLLTLSLT